MTKYEEVFLISQLLLIADDKENIDLNKDEIWGKLLLKNETRIGEDYLIKLDEKNVINFEVIGEDGFKPIYICSINSKLRKF